MSRPGIRFVAESPLVGEAVELIETGPRTSAELAARVLGIRGGPAAVTDALVEELLSEETRVERGADRRWTTRARPGDPELGFDRMRFAVVDVETTGGMAGRGGRIIEVAVVRVERRQIVDIFSSLVNPGVRVQPWITRLTGIHDGMVRPAPRFSGISEEVRHVLRGRVFVAHNVGYDWGFIREEMRGAGADPPRGSRLCTLHMARRLLPGLDRRGLDSLARYYGIEIHERHRARGDAVATARALLCLLDDAERRGWDTWRALRRGLSGAGRVQDGAGDSAAPTAARAVPGIDSGVEERTDVGQSDRKDS